MIWKIGDRVRVQENLLWSDKRGQTGVVSEIWEHRQEGLDRGRYVMHPYTIIDFADGSRAIFDDNEFKVIEGESK